MKPRLCEKAAEHIFNKKVGDNPAALIILRAYFFRVRAALNAETDVQKQFWIADGYTENKIQSIIKSRTFHQCRYQFRRYRIARMRMKGHSFKHIGSRYGVSAYRAKFWFEKLMKKINMSYDYYHEISHQDRTRGFDRELQEKMSPRKMTAH